MFRRAAVLLLVLASTALADPPTASYLFPAGGQRGATVKVRAGGLFLHEKCSWELTGGGLRLSPTLARVPTLWVEGPMLPLPDSQRQEDYPRDMLGEVRIDAKAVLGPRRFRVWTAEGAASGPAFVVGDLPEVVEEEGRTPGVVSLPVTVNGRIFPREEIDRWSFTAKKGQTIVCKVVAASIGSPLDSRLEVRGPDGRTLAENDDYHGADSLVSFTAPADGVYQAEIQDAQRGGSQRHVYRLTITAGPHVRHAYPLGGRRGTTVALQLDGDGLPGTRVDAAIPRNAGPTWSGSVALGKGASAGVTLDTDDLVEEQEVEPNDTEGRKVAWPAVLNGRIDRPGDVDCWRVAARKGEVLAIELRASRLGSRLEGVVEILGPDGAVVGRLERDGEVIVTAPRDGDYWLRVRDRFASRGGPALGYRLRIDRPRPAFALALAADSLTVPRGKPANLVLKVDRTGGFTGEVALRFSGLPVGVKAVSDKVPPGAATITLTFTAAKDARMGVAHVSVSGVATGKAGGPAATAKDDLLLAVALTAPFKLIGVYDQRNAPRGSVFRKHFKIERNGYDGPLEASLSDRQARHLQGVTGPRLVIAPGQSEFVYPVTLPPWMEIGRTSRACVMLTGKLRDGGAECTVSTFSQEQKEQVVAVIETGRLGLDVGRKSLAAFAGKVSLPVEVRRGKGLARPVTVELVLPPSARGVSAGKVVLLAGESKGALEVSFADRVENAFGPVTVRATLETAEGPVSAETVIEIVRP